MMHHNLQVNVCASSRHRRKPGVRDRSMHWPVIDHDIVTVVYFRTIAQAAQASLHPPEAHLGRCDFRLSRVIRATAEE
jgi:hypothetical protein